MNNVSKLMLLFLVFGLTLRLLVPESGLATSYVSNFLNETTGGSNDYQLGHRLVDTRPSSVSTSDATIGGISLVRIFNELETNFKFVLFALDMAFLVPFGLLNALNLPVSIVLTLGISLSLIMYLSILGFIRGTGDG